MKVNILILIVGLTASNFGVHGQYAEGEINPYADRNYNNPVFAEYTEPNATETEDLMKLRYMKVLDFYTGLDELYLTGGFDKAGTINSIILSQKDISNDVYELLIRTLKTTRREIKYGDVSLDQLDEAIEENKDHEQTKQLLQAVKQAIRNATGTTDQETFIQKISKIQLETVKDLKELNSGKGKNAQLLAQLLQELKGKIDGNDLKILSKAIQNAFYSGIGGTDAVRDTVIAGARLLYNFGGSLDVTKKKCSELAMAYKKDKNFKKKLDGANEIVKRINRTDGEYGYKLVFESFFDEQAPTGNMIFLPSKLVTLETLLPFFKVLEEADIDILKTMVKSISLDRSRIRQFQWFIDKIQNETVASELMTERFEVEINDEQVPIYRAIVEYITALSVDSAYFLRYLKSVRDMVETENYHKFTRNLVRFSQLSRNIKWRDDWVAIKEASEIALSSGVTVFKGLNETVTGSYEEVFLAMEMILDGGKVQEKCKFIGEFFSGLKDQNKVLEAIGLPVADMHQYVDSTEYIDALIEVLRAAESYPNLQSLLAYHAKYTTVDKKPLESMNLIDNFIRFLEQSGRWNKKRFHRIGR